MSVDEAVSVIEVASGAIVLVGMTAVAAAVTVPAPVLETVLVGSTLLSRCSCS